MRETHTYPDGSQVVGVPPFPEQSPLERAAAARMEADSLRAAREAKLRAHIEEATEAAKEEEWVSISVPMSSLEELRDLGLAHRLCDGAL